jgi:periplasmic protein CpxP/Spy
MPPFPSSAVSVPFARSAAIAALLSATMLASPLTAARADSAAKAPIQLAQAANPAAKAATQGKGETVEQRITNLHAALKITPDEETLWNGVAQAMRDNAAAMDKLIAATQTTPPQNMSAVDDLNTYQKFTQAHLDGLANLIPAFGKLYAAMPDAQKKVADGVFRSTRTAPAAVQTSQAAAPHQGQGYMVHNWDGHHHHHWWGHRGYDWDSEAEQLNRQELNRLGAGR